jgi:hypothetical protein
MPWLNLIPWKLVGYAAIAAMLLWLGSLVMGAFEDQRKLAAVESQLETERAQYAEQSRIRAAQEKITHDRGVAYENGITDLRTQLIDARARHPVVRLCGGTGSVPRIPDPAGIPDAAASERERAAAEPTAGPNISVGLYEIAENADTCAIRLIALQSWITEQQRLFSKRGGD